MYDTFYTYVYIQYTYVTQYNSVYVVNNYIFVLKIDSFLKNQIISDP